MLSCQGCIKHCLQSLVGDYTVISSPLRTTVSNATRHSRQGLRRTFATSRIQGAAEGQDEAADYSSEKPKAKGYTNYNDHNAKPKRAEWLKARGTTPEVKKRLQPKNVEKHLVYLKDPVKLADDIRRILRDDDFDTAITTVRAASRDVQCTVSWNHLIDWQMSKGKMNAAIKTYNEMKKRSQFPDSVTYTIIFRGCAEHPDSKQALSKVMSIYQSMTGELSRVRPTTIHLNAVLKACARAKDMDALWAVAGNMPRKGMRAPNNLTYTTILNALRFYSVGDLRGDLSPKQIRENMRQALVVARKVWLDIIGRWREGDIFMDEELACSMGRFLINGNTEECDDIFSLLEQTMNIPRMTPRAETNAANSHHIAQIIEADSEIPSGDGGPEFSELGLENRLGVFVPVKPPKGSVKVPGTYATPKQNTLSLIMLALDKLELRAPATAYWKYLTENLQIDPDAENYASYLRILRRFRSSTEATELIVAIPRSKLALKHVILGMSTCYRDKNNHNVFVNSGKILDAMEHSILVPDVRVLEKYLAIAIESPAYYATSPKTMTRDSREESNYALGRQITRALERVEKASLNLKSELNYGSFVPPPSEGRKPSPERLARVSLVDDAVTLWSQMIRAYDVCMNKALVPRDQYSSLAVHRNTLQAWVTRYKAFNFRERSHIEMEQKLKKKYFAAREDGDHPKTDARTEDGMNKYTKDNRTELSIKHK
ncbi:pentatricopeptide repeat domain-containing protein [Phlyctema vagabunda]|uniref:Pentatricopeptide repeat domain-containing protein n=1 Tax=Phlyctema vagabunda TaxID=108571 RepID=A0ABR4PR98_9HELO